MTRKLGLCGLHVRLPLLVSKIISRFSISIVMKTHTLVVFSGCPRSGGLAADFAKISKQFISDGLNPTCLSSQDLRIYMTPARGPMVYGRDDLGRREIIHTVNDPAFYQHVHGQLKSRVINWVTQASSSMQNGDRMIIVVAAHGEIRTGNIFLKTHQDAEFLRVEELYLALKQLPANVRILFVNLACFSGKWGALAKKMDREGRGHETLIETASSSSETSQNHRSMSNRVRCSFFGCAFVNELVTFPDATIRERTRRIREEMECLPAGQNSSTPQCFPAPRGLLSSGITQFISTPNILQSILNSVSTDQRDKARLKIIARGRQKSRAKRYLKKFLNLFGMSDLISNSSNSMADVGALIIRNYVDELGPSANAGEKSDLVDACFDALNGVGGDELKQQVVLTIMWQRRQLSLVGDHLLDLKTRGYLSRLLDLDKTAKESTRELDDSSLEIYTATHDRLWSLPCVRELLYSSGDLVPILFQDGFNFLLQNIFFNQMLDPINFQIDKVISVTEHFFTNSAALATSI